MTKRSRFYFGWKRHLEEQGQSESFMGLIPYLDAKHRGIEVSQFQHDCFKYGSGMVRNTVMRRNKKI